MISFLAPGDGWAWRYDQRCFSRIEPLPLRPSHFGPGLLFSTGYPPSPFRSQDIENTRFIL